MGYSRNWISNWGWYVCSRNWSSDSRFNWFRDCKPYFKVQFLFPQNITVQMCINKHEAVQQILETLQVKGIPILSYEVETSQQGTEIVYKVGMQLKTYRQKKRMSLFSICKHYQKLHS